MASTITREEAEALAERVVNEWDEETLLGYAIEHLTDAYLIDIDSYNQDSEN